MAARSAKLNAKSRAKRSAERGQSASQTQSQSLRRGIRNGPLLGSRGSPLVVFLAGRILPASGGGAGN